MKVKKLAALLMSSVMAMSLAACGGSGAADTAEPASAESTETAESADTAESTEKAQPEAMKGSVEGELTVSIWDVADDSLP